MSTTNIDYTEWVRISPNLRVRKSEYDEHYATLRSKGFTEKGATKALRNALESFHFAKMLDDDGNKTVNF